MSELTIRDVEESFGKLMLAADTDNLEGTSYYDVMRTFTKLARRESGMRIPLQEKLYHAEVKENFTVPEDHADILEEELEEAVNTQQFLVTEGLDIKEVPHECPECGWTPDDY